MTSVRILDGATEPIRTPTVKDGSLAPLTGLATMVVAIQRLSDSFWYDFNDDTFKSTGWTTRQQTMTEVSATLAPGVYQYDWDTSQITNATSDDTYFCEIDDTGASAANVPMHAEIKVDQWVQGLYDEHDETQNRLPATLNGGRMRSHVEALDAATITAAVIATDAVDADALAADAVTEIQTGLATASALAAVQADTDDIQTRLPAALVGGRMDSDVGNMQAGVVNAAAIATDAIDADALAADAVTEIAAGVRDQALATTTPGTIGRALVHALYNDGFAVAIHVDPTNGSPGAVVGVNGTIANPVDNETDARALANAIGVQAYCINNGTLTLTQAHADWLFYGGREGGFGLVSVNGQDVDRSVYKTLGVTGAFGGTPLPAQLYECRVFNVSNFTATMIDCWCFLDIALADGTSTTWNGGGSINTSSIPTTIACGGASAATTFQCQQLTGYMKLTDCAHADTEVQLHMHGGHVEIDASCTAGSILLTGIFTLTNNTGGATVNTDGRVGEVADDYLGQPAVHGSGSWESGAAATDWSATEREQIRQRLSLDGTQSDPTTDDGDFETLMTRFGIGNAETEYEDATATTPGSIKSPPTTGTRLSRTVTQTATNKVKVGP